MMGLTSLAQSSLARRAVRTYLPPLPSPPLNLFISLSFLRSTGLCYDSSHQRRVARSQTVNPPPVIPSTR
ncbi:unnamed protein product [Pleuronectes platessa]|uniref:Uncharacterized protein n=1 Tax=Pleuronectes platessa TaxID=8262 RepID=A0A9N7UD22_PLEPL|nr:unnamed protein product [Pleuronectes platessa]